MFLSQGDGNISPGGFEFGVQGWTWGEPVPKSITFFMDGTAMVCDQYGRPIKGSVVDGREVWFASRPPQEDDPNPGHIPVTKGGGRPRIVKLATHAEVIAALSADRVDWRTLTRAGWPQLPYEEMKKLDKLPPYPFNEIHNADHPACSCLRCSVKDPAVRRDITRIKAEYVDAVKPAEVEAE